MTAFFLSVLEKTSSYGEPLSPLHRSERHCSLILLNHAKLIGGLCYTLATWYIGIETYNRPWGIAAAPPKKKLLNGARSRRRHPFVASLQKSAREKRPEYFIRDMLSSSDYLPEKVKGLTDHVSLFAFPIRTHNPASTNPEYPETQSWALFSALSINFRCIHCLFAFDYFFVTQKIV